MILNDQQQDALDLVAQGKNVFITGSGGVGKSVLIRAIEAMLDDVLICAPTGVAALNINGSTLHRIFTLPFSICSDADQHQISNYTRSLVDKAKVLIIDEVSMVRSDIFTLVDKKLRRIRNTNLAFGGLQVVVVGDFYQLSPVLMPKDKQAFYALYDSEFCFSTPTWVQADFQIVHLTEVMRQADADTVELLNNIRQGRYLSTCVSIVNETCANHTDNEPIILCTTNKTADSINNDEYMRVVGPEQTFTAHKWGTFSDHPVPEVVNLKINAKVVICANNHGQGYYNGDTGTYQGMDEDSLIVYLHRLNRTVSVTKHTWENTTYAVVDDKLVKNVIGNFIQYPVKLGYAITIHKSQGMTFDRAHIHLGNGAFAHGQTYVALSRIRSMDNLTLESPIRKRDIIINPDVSSFYEHIGAVSNHS